jgi:glycosyltransferase involved in cell wall biosynthesis
MKLLFFPKYTDKGPSSRYRSYQYLPFFAHYDLEVYPFFDDNYNPQSFKNFKGILYILKCYIKRFNYMLSIKKNDVIFLEYEFFPYLPFNLILFKILKITYVVDYDDAIFHNYNLHSNKLIRIILKNKIAKVIKHAHTVITGSPYLTNYANKYNSNVLEIPTSIDYEKYQSNTKQEINTDFVIGWIGSKTTSINLIKLIPVFENLKKQDINFEIRCIGFNKNLESQFKHLPFKVVPWNAQTEIEEIKKFNVGIMPLENTPFNKGKCAFKLIQYMACGLTTISTPLEANIKVNRANKNLFANTLNDWTSAFIKVYENPEYYNKIALKNKKIVEKHYATKCNKELYLKIFKSFSFDVEQ